MSRTENSPDKTAEISNYKREWARKKREQNREVSKSKELEKNRNMYFLKEIMRSLNLSQNMLAKATGITQPAISYWFVYDDCKLSIVESVMEKLSLRIECSLKFNKPFNKIEHERYTTEMNINREILLPALDWTDTGHRSAMDQAVRLKFLAEAIRNHYGNIAEFSKAAEYTAASVYYWFSKDDIKISNLYEVAKKLDMKVSWKVTEASPQTKH